MSDSLTDLGERLLILEGCTPVCCTPKVGCLKKGVDECLLNNGGYLYKVHR